MKKYKAEELKEKFVIAFDTIVDGHQCIMENEEGVANYGPLLFNTQDEAFREIFDGNYSMLKSHLESEQLEELNEGVTPDMIAEMGEILDTGDISKMVQFLENHPQCNDSGEWVEPADGFVLGRKVIAGKNGINIQGRTLDKI